jgi:hypothetical protein
MFRSSVGEATVGPETREVRERAEIIQEAAEEEHAEGRFRNQAAICVAVLAIFLAISSLKTASCVRDVINTNIHANSNEALFHIKQVEQRSNELAADELKLSLAVDKNLLQPADKALIRSEIQRYESEMARLESDPESKEGKQELLQGMHDWEAKHHHAEERLQSSEGSDITYQVAIVLCSVCIVLKSRRLLQFALVVGAGATFLMLNSFFGWIRL